MGRIGVEGGAVTGLRLRRATQHLQHHRAVPERGRPAGARNPREQPIELGQRASRVAAHGEGGGGGAADPRRDAVGSLVEHPPEKGRGRRGIPAAQARLPEPAGGACAHRAEGFVRRRNQRREKGGGGRRIPVRKEQPRPSDAERRIAGEARGSRRQDPGRFRPLLGIAVGAVEQQPEELHPEIPPIRGCRFPAGGFPAGGFPAGGLLVPRFPSRRHRQQQGAPALAETTLFIAVEEPLALRRPSRVRVLDQELPEAEADRPAPRRAGQRAAQPGDRFRATPHRRQTAPEFISGARGRPFPGGRGPEQRERPFVVALREPQPAAFEDHCGLLSGSGRAEHPARFRNETGLPQGDGELPPRLGSGDGIEREQLRDRPAGFLVAAEQTQQSDPQTEGAPVAGGLRERGHRRRVVEKPDQRLGLKTVEDRIGIRDGESGGDGGQRPDKVSAVQQITHGGQIAHGGKTSRGGRLANRRGFARAGPQRKQTDGKGAGRSPGNGADHEAGEEAGRQESAEHRVSDAAAPRSAEPPPAGAALPHRLGQEVEVVEIHRKAVAARSGIRDPLQHFQSQHLLQEGVQHTPLFRAQAFQDLLSAKGPSRGHLRDLAQQRPVATAADPVEHLNRHIFGSHHLRRRHHRAPRVPLGNHGLARHPERGVTDFVRENRKPSGEVAHEFKSRVVRFHADPVQRAPEKAGDFGIRPRLDVHQIEDARHGLVMAGELPAHPFGTDEQQIHGKRPFADRHRVHEPLQPEGERRRGGEAVDVVESQEQAAPTVRERVHDPAQGDVEVPGHGGQILRLGGELDLEPEGAHLPDPLAEQLQEPFGPALGPGDHRDPVEGLPYDLVGAGGGTEDDMDRQQSVFILAGAGREPGQ